MFSAHYNRKPESAADHASLNTPSAEGRLGNLNFIHFLSQPSRSTNKKFKRATPNACGNVRFHHTSTVIGSNAFIIGGQCSLDNSSTSLATTLLKMDFSTLVVNEKNSTIVPVTGHGAVPINDSKILILFGKESIAPPKLTNIVQQMDVQTGVVNTFNINGTAPPARYAHTVALIDNKVYTIGGINKNNDILGEITIIDLISKSWNIISKNSLPPIAGHSTVIVDKYLISCFGFNPKFELRNDCNVFDTVKNVYVQSNISGTPPSPRSYSTMVTKDDDKKIYVFGGFDKDYQGNNDLYILDAKNIPSLSWSPIPISADSNQNLMPSPRGAHTAIIKSEMMFILGGYSGKNLTDNETYIFNVKSSTWVDPKSMPSFSSHSDNLDNSKSFENSSSNSNSFPIWGIIVGAIGVIIMILIAIICFLSIRRRRLKVNSIEDKESQSDPYGKLPSNDEIKEIKSKDSPILEQITLELIPPLQLSQDMEEKQKENESKSLEIHSNSSEDLTSFKFSSEKYKIDDIPSKRLSTESQRMKRTHRRTSSVSLTPTDVASLTRPRSFVHHKSSLSTSVINNCSRKTSSLSNEFDPISATINSNDSLSATTLEKNHIRDSKATCRSARSVNSLQWVGFNNIMMAEQEEKRLSLHVRNALSTISTIRSSNTSEDFRKSTESEDDNDYVIFGDYIDTTPKYPNNINNNIHQSNSIDNNGLQKRSSTQNQSKIEICRKTIANIDEDDRSTRESGIIDNYMHKSQNYADSNYTNDNDDNDKRSSKKSKRSSKRASKVSFALTDEKIEYYETESSKSVGFARISGRTSSQSSSSSSSTPSIIEEEEEEDNNGKDDQERNKCLKSNSPVRNSIKELMMEQGIHKLYNI